MKLRTFAGEPVRGKMITNSPASREGSPVLLVNDAPFLPEDAEFFLEYATERELEMLEEGGYDLPEWEDMNEGYEEDEEDEETEWDDD